MSIEQCGLYMLSSKVKRFDRGCRVLGMATSEGEGASRRRKRAWRQPRQAAGPTSSAIEPTTEDIPLSTSESRAETSSTVSDSVTESEPRLRGEEPVTELDGSMMEGVCCTVVCGACRRCDVCVSIRVVRYYVMPLH